MIRRPSMISRNNMLILILGRGVLWRVPEGTWYYDDSVAWVTVVLLMVWLSWFLVDRYLRARALRRRPGRTNYRLLNRTARIKRELSSQYLRPGFSANIHAVGIGMLGSDYCIHVFLDDADKELWAGSGAATLPANYRGVPVVPIEMPMAGFLSDKVLGSLETPHKYPRGIREPQEVIIGGISGAH